MVDPTCRHYYRRHCGAVLSTAVEQSVYVMVSRKFDDAVRVIMIFAPREWHEAIRRALHPLREVPFRFAPQGSNVILVH